MILTITKFAILVLVTGEPLVLDLLEIKTTGLIANQVGIVDQRLTIVMMEWFTLDQEEGIACSNLLNRGMILVVVSIKISGSDSNCAVVIIIRNGILIGQKAVSIPEGGFYPMVEMHSCGEIVRVNFNATW